MGQEAGDDADQRGQQALKVRGAAGPGRGAGGTGCRCRVRAVPGGGQQRQGQRQRYRQQLSSLGILLFQPLTKVVKNTVSLTSSSLRELSRGQSIVPKPIAILIMGD